MLLLNVMRRVTKDWKGFCILGLSYALLNMLLAIPLGLISGWLLGSWASKIITGSMEEQSAFGTAGMTMSQPLSGADIAGLIFIVVLLALFAYLMLTAAAIAYGGMMGGAATFAKGGLVSIGACWQVGWQHCSKFMGLILMGLPLLAAVAAAGEMSIGTGPKMVVNGVAGALFVNLGFYPAYLLVTSRVGVLEAVGQGLRLMVRRPAEAALSGVIWIAFGMVGNLATALPRQWFSWDNLGWMLVMMFGVWVLSIFHQLLQMSYFAERFEAVIRPNLI